MVSFKELYDAGGEMALKEQGDQSPQADPAEPRQRKDREVGARVRVPAADKVAHGEIETHHPGYLSAQDTYYVGSIKGVGRIYQQTFLDTYTKVSFAKLYDRNNALVAADLLNDRVIPWFEQKDVKLLRILTDRESEYLGECRAARVRAVPRDREHRSHQTKAKSPQTNGICERFHKTVKDEFHSVAFRKKFYTTLEDLQADLDAWMSWFSNERTHSGRYCYGKTPMETFTDSRRLAKEKELDLQYLTPGVPTQPSVSDQV